MFGDVVVRAQAEIIADPRKLLGQIDALLLLPNQTPAITKTVAAIRRLVLEAVQVEYVQTRVDVEGFSASMHEDLMEYTNEQLRHSLGERLVRVVGPVVTRTTDVGDEN